MADMFNVDGGYRPLSAPTRLTGQPMHDDIDRSLDMLRASYQPSEKRYTAYEMAAFELDW